MAMGGMKNMPGMPNALPLSKGLESRGAKSKGGKDKFAAYKSNLGAGYGGQTGKNKPGAPSGLSGGLSAFNVPKYGSGGLGGMG